MTTKEIYLAPFRLLVALLTNRRIILASVLGTLFTVFPPIGEIFAVGIGTIIRFSAVLIVAYTPVAMLLAALNGRPVPPVIQIVNHLAKELVVSMVCLEVAVPSLIILIALVAGSSGITSVTAASMMFSATILGVIATQILKAFLTDPNLAE